MWFTLQSGKKFHHLECTSKDIHIEDIAHALSNICRYGGHSKWHYSVAQHSVLVSYHTKNKLWGLLHDATEAYVGDLIRPIKNNLPGFIAIEEQVEKAVKDKFGFTNLTREEELDVKRIDLMLLNYEAKALLGVDPQTSGWQGVPPPDPKIQIEIQKLTPNEAKDLFLERFKELSK